MHYTDRFPLESRTHISATPHRNRHSLVTAEQQVHRPNFLALRRNWFSQLHFHFSNQTTSGLSVNTTACPEYVPGDRQNLIYFSLVHSLPFPNLVKIHPNFWVPLCHGNETVVLSAMSVWNVGVLWPNGWMDQDTTWQAGWPRPRRHCVRWGCSSPTEMGTADPYF